MIVGADAASDGAILEPAPGSTRRTRLRRVYYSAFSPIPDAQRPVAAASGAAGPRAPAVPGRLAVALLRLRGRGDRRARAPPGCSISSIDPKLAWALAHRERFPVDINKADRETPAAGAGAGRAHGGEDPGRPPPCARSGSTIWAGCGSAMRKAHAVHRHRRLPPAVPARSSRGPARPPGAAAAPARSVRMNGRERRPMIEAVLAGEADFAGWRDAGAPAHRRRPSAGCGRVPACRRAGPGSVRRSRSRRRSRRRGSGSARTGDELSVPRRFIDLARLGRLPSRSRPLRPALRHAVADRRRRAAPARRRGRSAGSPGRGDGPGGPPRHPQDEGVRPLPRGQRRGRTTAFYIAWFEPDHHIVAATAPFFAERFAAMRGRS